MEKVRIDKWLWAARFFRTRALAKTAIEGGKVRIAGQRIKPSRTLEIGTLVEIRQGWDEKVVLVTGISEQRRGAPEAALLYQETDESIAARESRALQRRAQPAMDSYVGKPSKKQRRQIHRFREDVGRT